MPPSLQNLVDSIMASESTGLPANPNGLGKYYLSESETVSPEEAYAALLNQREIKVPTAGAGSFHNFFESVSPGSKVEKLDTTSSAGDWTFAFQPKDDNAWYPAFQTNRYPYHGFAYSIDFSLPFPTLEELSNTLFSA
jgi:hypothetical protein